MILMRCYFLYRDKSELAILCDNGEDFSVSPPVQNTRLLPSSSQRPNSLDLKVPQYSGSSTSASSTLVKQSQDVTPSQTPKSCGLVNPGFVFETVSSNGSSAPVKKVSTCLVDYIHSLATTLNVIWWAILDWEIFLCFCVFSWFNVIRRRWSEKPGGVSGNYKLLGLLKM